MLIKVSVFTVSAEAGLDCPYYGFGRLLGDWWAICCCHSWSDIQRFR